MNSLSRLTIGVTGLNATDNPAPGVAVLRSLRQLEGTRPHLVGLAYDALDPGIYAKDVADDVFMLPYPSSSQEAFFERLREIHDEVGFSVILPTLDAELPAFIALEPQLRALGIGTLLPTREQFDARTKANLPHLAQHAGLRTPDTVVLSSAHDLRMVHERLRYPFFIKGPYYGAKLVTCVEEALAAYHTTIEEWGFPVIAQACVPEDGREELNVVALGDGQGALLGAVAMKKLAVTDKGKGWAGVTIRDPQLTALAAQFMRATSWRGPCEIEVIRTRGGVYHLIEINPRFPAWVFLATSAGMNLPAQAAAMAAGQAVAPPGEYRAGTIFVRISIDQIATIADLERMVMTGEVRHSAESSSPSSIIEAATRAQGEPL